MKLPGGLLAAHLLALMFGLAGLLIALPNTGLWAGDPMAMQAFNFGMSYGGATHILFGAAAVFALGWKVLGPRKTVIFLIASTLISLSSELIGTGTGWPFGNYAYTDFLGYKILDHVPYTIPLSWFYMGLTSYLLGSLIATVFRFKNHVVWSIALGVYFLTAWDLVLDPAMAAPGLAVQFWVWRADGPYFGMPLQNFVGWSLTGLIFMTVSRFIWASDPPTNANSSVTIMLFTIYAANIVFAMALSAGAGLWGPVAIALVAGLLPACLVFRQLPTRKKQANPRTSIAPAR